METAPLVSVLVAVSNGERYVRTALESIRRQSLSDLELLVVDDGSTDATPEILDELAARDPRLRIVRNDERQGLAASLNSGLDEARGRYVARLDADDVALPRRLEQQLRRIRSDPPLAVVGSAVLDLHDTGRAGRLHVMPPGTTAVRWTSLFSSPFFHPSVLLDRELLDTHGLRYDADYLESEDYDLWARLLAVADGDNLPEPLVLYRVHPGQASQARREIQRDFQLRVALREIAQVAPALDAERAELAWRMGIGERLDAEQLEDAGAALVDLVHAFEERFRQPGSGFARESAARAFARAALHRSGDSRRRALRFASRLDRAFPARMAARGARRTVSARRARRAAEEWLADLESSAVLETAADTPADAPGAPPIRVAAVFPEPTPYRAPLLDRVAALPEIDLTVIYAAATVSGRTWGVTPGHRSVFLRGARLPGAQRILHHDYPLTPGVARALGRVRPDVAVVSGWSTFASQSAIAWCRAHDIPYLLVVESHDEGPRAGWRRRVKGAIVPRVVRGSSGALVTGTLARQSMVARGAPPERVRIFANTIDVEEFGDRSAQLAARRPALREDLGAAEEDVVVLCVARLSPEKGLDVLVHAVAEARDRRLLLVLVGDGPERERLGDLADVLGVRAVFAGDREWEQIVELYVAADVFALLSARETWAVVVNEAAACGLPLVLSDRVGAAHDLLHDGENGFLVEAGDVDGAAEALRRLAADPALRAAQGARSRELAQDWGYGPSVAGFLAAVREAVSDTGRTARGQ